MKKFICCALAAITSYCTIAQPVITAADLNPVPGETLYYNTDIGEDTVYFDGPGAAGAGVTWDFHIMPAGGTSITNFMLCTSAPICDSFTGNLAGLRTLTWPSGADTSYFYFSATSTAFTSLGYSYYSTNEPAYYKSGVKLPMIYGDTYMDTSFHKSSSAAAYTYDPITSVDTVQIDGYGTLILPGGTVNNVLRMKRSTNSASTHYEEYYWFSPEYHYCIMALLIQYEFGTDIPSFNNFAYRAILTPTGVKNTQSDDKLIVAPNPASDNVNLSFNLANADNSSITIYDVTGTVVDKKYALVQGDNNISINTSSLPAGTYLLRLQTVTGTTTQKIAVIH